MRGSTVILNVILVYLIFMCIITVMYVCCDVDVNKECMLKKMVANSL